MTCIIGHSECVLKNMAVIDNVRAYASPSVEDIENTIPDQLINRESREMTICDIIIEFQPRNIDLKDAGYTVDDIKKKEDEDWVIRIPPRQRFYVWEWEHQNDLIDSIIKNFPIPSVIISKTQDRGVFNQEDGQQRFITLWRFAHNLFPYSPTDGVHIYYNKVPKGISDAYTLLDDFPTVKHRIDTYTIPVIVAKQTSGADVLPEIFERLNSGVDLSDGDKLWNRQNSNIVKRSLEIGRDPSISSHLKKYMGIDLTNIKTKSKMPLRSLVGMVITFAKEFEDSDVWGDTLTKSFRTHVKYLDMDIHDITPIVKNIEEILRVYHLASPGNKSLNNDSPSFNVAFTRITGVMIYDLCKRLNTVPETHDTPFCEYWVKVLDTIRSDPNHIDSPEHMIQGMYKNAGTKGSNSNIGCNIRKRYVNLRRIMDE